MSIFERKDIIKENDHVVICVGNDYETIKVKIGENFENRFGKFQHSDLIGLKYGGKLYTNDKKSFVYILHPNPSLWSISLKHMTQILYAPDISLILFRLNILKNKNVIEAGTGSTSLTHSIARALQPHGRLFSFEFQKERYENAVKIIKNNNLNNVVLSHRNVIESGFGMIEKVDAIVLDLPAPWTIITEAKNTLKAGLGSNICIFCPCIEQVQKCVKELDVQEFSSIDVVEFIERPMMVKPILIKNVDSNDKKIEDDRIEISGYSDAKDLRITAKPGYKSYKCLNRSQKAVGHTGYLIFALCNNS